MADNNLVNDSPIEDLIITDNELYCNNTFSLKALNDTLERLSVINFWGLYHTQRSKLGMKHFKLAYNEFLLTLRLDGEKNVTYYPKRYVAYVDYVFIEPELRKKYRNSDFYNVAVSQNTISKNPSIFKHNFLVFIEGEYIFTCEVFPLESKLGVIIDLSTPKSDHGITYEKHCEYCDKNVDVDIVIVPNFNMVDTVTNKYVLENLEYKIPFDKITGSEVFGEDTLCFVNTSDGLSRRYYEDKIYINEDDRVIEINKTITPGADKYRFDFITLKGIYDVIDLVHTEPYFQLDTKMPCPIEHMIMFVMDENGRYMYTDKKIELFYPNIYKVSDIEEGHPVRILVFQNENDISKNEEYFNEIAKYEEYVDMLPKYMDDTIPEILKRYRPSSYVFSIDDYKNSIYVPSTMSYKVQKLHKTIYENPWALVVYLDLLNLPTDKFYLDMEKIDLSIRLRTESSDEELDEGINPVIFDEEMYVFAMNRHFVNTRTYGFRIFIDGYFQLDTEYVILPGKDWYYIYLPKSKITETSVVEIERYKLFNFETSGTTDSLETPLVEMELNNNEGYSREIYLVDAETSRYLNKEKDFKVDVLYKFNEGVDRWITIPLGRNIPIENKFRVYLLNENYLGRRIKVGINRTMNMHTGSVYQTPTDELHDFTIFEYDQLEIPNSGGYDIGYYRLFNNGKLLIPPQYYMEHAKLQGGNDVIRTGCSLYDGDQFTADRVPARFTVIYYQHEVDEVNKKGYVDLDGKVELPISLKWYDIYLNGVKLHKKNIEIISPTKFYIQGVDSRKNLVILMKNRDPEVFKLADHTDLDSPDYNNTIMDELMESVNGLKEIIDNTKEVIDPDNSSHSIASNVAMNQNALIFFYEYFVYTFINANYKQITQEIKDAFPSLIREEDGIMEIDSNMGCVESDEISGYLIKLIECNYIEDERSVDMFTGDNVNYDGLGMLQDRFAIRPLNTTNYEFGLPQEFMCDPETGEPAIMNEDGTVTTVSTLFRTKNFIESFSENIMMYGMGKSDIYQITFDEEFKVYVYESGSNILTEDVSTEKEIKKFAIGLDATFMTTFGDSKMLRVADVDPTVIIRYLDGDTEKEVQHSITRLHNYIIEASGIVTLKSITIEGIEANIKTFIHSLLIAF